MYETEMNSITVPAEARLNTIEESLNEFDEILKNLHERTPVNPQQKPNDPNIDEYASKPEFPDVSLPVINPNFESSIPNPATHSFELDLPPSTWDEKLLNAANSSLNSNEQNLNHASSRDIQNSQTCISEIAMSLMVNPGEEYQLPEFICFNQQNPMMRSEANPSRSETQKLDPAFEKSVLLESNSRSTQNLAMNEFISESQCQETTKSQAIDCASGTSDSEISNNQGSPDSHQPSTTPSTYSESFDDIAIGDLILLTECLDSPTTLRELDTQSLDPGVNQVSVKETSVNQPLCYTHESQYASQELSPTATGQQYPIVSQNSPSVSREHCSNLPVSFDQGMQAPNFVSAQQHSEIEVTHCVDQIPPPDQSINIPATSSGTGNNLNCVAYDAFSQPSVTASNPFELRPQLQWKPGVENLTVQSYGHCKNESQNLKSDSVHPNSNRFTKIKNFLSPFISGPRKSDSNDKKYRTATKVMTHVKKLSRSSFINNENQGLSRDLSVHLPETDQFSVQLETYNTETSAQLKNESQKPEHSINNSLPNRPTEQQCLLEQNISNSIYSVTDHTLPPNNSVQENSRSITNCSSDNNLPYFSGNYTMNYDKTVQTPYSINSSTVLSPEEDKLLKESSTFETWCKVTYHEFDVQIGESVTVNNSFSTLTIDGYVDPYKCENHFSLGALNNLNRGYDSEKVLLHIGKGVVLDQRSNGDVWLRCVSDHSVYVQSHFLDLAAGRPLGNVVHKIYPLAYVKVFDLHQSFRMIKDKVVSVKNSSFSRKTPVVGPSTNRVDSLSTLNSIPEISTDELRKFFLVRFSFVKGWGPDYPTRLQIKESPCWIEVQMHRPLRMIDQILRPNEKK